MPTLHLVCGLPGSGKTTLARRLEQEIPALRLTSDEWMARIVGSGFDAEKRVAVESIQWEVAQRALTLGIDVVLESGFWKRAERDQFRRRAAELGCTATTHFLDVPRAELWRRLDERNANLPPDTFRVTKSDLDQWAREFEPPTDDELPSEQGIAHS
jgi:predicted kinase